MAKSRQLLTKPRHVVVALRMAGIAGQDKLNGVFEYLSEGHRWQLSIYRTRHEFTAETVHREIERGAEGFIVGIPETNDALAALAASDLPVVVMNVSGGGIENRQHQIAFVKSDSQAVGREGAAELLREGSYQSYGYVGYRTDEDWSRDRGEAFRATLCANGLDASVFDRAHFPKTFEDRSALARWLAALPKPCGILAACDDRAFEILDACREAGFRVPADVSVLGVNNDPILCENAEPRLSSIQPDFVREGQTAAALLDQMMNAPIHRSKDTQKTTRIGIRTIVHRDSTYPQSESGRLIQKALAYIRRNALKGIGATDVAAHLKISSSLLNLRFRELQHKSVYETILTFRLEEVTRRLRQTREGIDTIAADCGWRNVNALKNLFKRKFGVSMRDYRQFLPHH